jgi:hypothetical protein
MMPTPLQDLRRHATRIEENDKLKDFVRLCIAGAFDFMLPAMRRVPLHTRVGMVTSGFTAATVGQNAPKPISSLSITETTLDERKAVVIAAITDELVRYSMESADGGLFQTELQNALAVETDETFIDILTSGATSFPSTGATAEAVRNDLRSALLAITTSKRSRLFLIVPPTIAKTLPVIHSSTGTGAFNGLRYDGGNVGGIEIVVSDGIASSSMVLVDASQVGAGSEGITLSASNQASVQMNTTPDSPPTASSAYISLWQMNQTALRAERYFGAVKLSTTGVCVITSVNYTGDSPGP